jgi:hypothetical protein
LERLRQEELAKQEAARIKKLNRNRKKKAARAARQSTEQGGGGAEAGGSTDASQSNSQDPSQGQNGDDGDDDDDDGDEDDDVADEEEPQPSEVLVEMYAVEMSWVLAWNKHVEEKAPAPGPITNNLLLTPDRKAVRPDLIKGKDFELVPAKTWHQLMKVLLLFVFTIFSFHLD